jgi:hypothetical protein
LPGNYFEAQDSFLSFSFWRGERRARALFAVVAAAGFLLYGAYLYRHACFAVGGSDSSGYANAARGLVEGTLVAPVPALARYALPKTLAPAFVPLGYVLLPGGGAIAPLYPIGFPLHESAAALVLGWEIGPYIVNPVAALLGLALIYLIGRELGLGNWAALGGATLFGASPTFVFHSVQPLSDVVATFWCLGAVYAALRSRTRPRWAMAAGLALGIAVLVRPMNLLLAAPLLFALSLKRGSLIRFFLGGLPCAALLFAYDWHCFGSPWTTGYGVLGLTGQFRIAAFPGRFLGYAGWVSRALTPLVGAGWIAAAFDRHIPWRVRALLFTWFAVFLLTYAFYDVGDGWWYTRFLLPGMPAVVLGFLLVVRDLVALASPHRRRWVAALAAVVIAATTVVGFRHTRRSGALGLSRAHANFSAACRYAADRLPADALVLSMDLSGALRYYTDLTPVRWDAFVNDDFVRTRPVAEAHGARWFALLRRYEVADAAPHIPGPWIFVGDVGDSSLWKLEPLEGSR